MVSYIAKLFSNKSLSVDWFVSKNELTGDIYFYGPQVAKDLGYGGDKYTSDRVARAITNHCDDAVHKSKQELIDLFGTDQINGIKFNNNGGKVIDESDLYNLIMGSKLPTAKAFKKWVTKEVLPTIRKTGGYLNPDSNIDWNNLDNIQRILDVAKEEREKRLLAEQTIKQQAPKVRYCNEVLEANDTKVTSIIASEFGMSARRLNQILNDLKIQRKVGGTWILYSEFQGKGYVKTKTSTFTKSDGSTGSSTLMCWTQEGRRFLYEKLISEGYKYKG